MSAIPKYLSTYAEPEARESLPEGKWQRIVVLPLCGEFSPALFESLENAARFVNLPTLAIAVVNEREDSPSDYQVANRKLREWLSERRKTALLSIHIVDRTGPRRFPPKEGVGLARKLGCDIALAVGGSAYLWTTDGDATVAQDYFDISGEESAAALLSPFRHTTDDTTEGKALAAYDRYLHYYREGLAHAGSPYAFHTIGSTIAVTPEAYAQVRGFPKREAGEDFYLLNKVAKVGLVRVRKSGMVTLAQRSSLRVPFGTGASTVEITSLFENKLPFRVYHPRCFDYLKVWLEVVESFCGHMDVATARKNCAQADPKLVVVLDEMRAFEMLETARRTRRGEAALRAHCFESFDAFRTLKFVHAVRDQIVGELDWQEATAVFLDSSAQLPEAKALFPHVRSCEAQGRTPV